MGGRLTPSLKNLAAEIDHPHGARGLRFRRPLALLASTFLAARNDGSNSGDGNEDSQGAVDAATFIASHPCPRGTKKSSSPTQPRRGFKQVGHRLSTATQVPQAPYLPMTANRKLGAVVDNRT